MSSAPFSIAGRRLLVVNPCEPQVLAALRREAAEVNEWSAPAGEAAYGETLVLALTAALDGSAPDVLVVPAPTAGDPAAGVVALAGLEAARRRGGPCCAWPAAIAGDSSPAKPPPWRVVEPQVLFEAMLERADTILGGAPGAASVAPPAPAADLVSVVVRSVDRLSLTQALASVALQTWRPIEIVVVNALGADHGPLPDVGAALSVRIVGADDGKRLPRAVAANAGLDAATGSLAIFLDDDDLMLPDHLSRLVPALAALPDAGAVYTGVEHGRIEQGRWQAGHRFDDDFDAVRLRFENYLPIHGVLFRRTGPWRELRFDAAFDLFEDWDYWLQFAARGPLVHLPGVSARYVAGAAGGADSAVFDDSPAAREARLKLYAKWHTAGGPAQTAAVLQRLQAEYREAASRRAELALLQQGHDALREVLEARDREVADAEVERGNLRALLAARQEEIEAAERHRRGLEELVGERERELADAQAQIAGLRAVLVEREREIADAQAQIDGLQGILGHRDREIAEYERALAAGADQIEALRQDLESQQATNATLAGQIAELHAEGPWQALSRTLRGKSDAPRS